MRRQMRVPLGEGQPRACPYFLVSLVGLFSCFVWLWLETFNRYGWYRDVSRIRCQYERKNSPSFSLSLSRHISSFARLRIVSWDVHKQLGNCSVVRSFICAEGDEGIMSIGHLYTVTLFIQCVCGWPDSSFVFGFFESASVQVENLIDKDRKSLTAVLCWMLYKRADVVRWSWSAKKDSRCISASG